MRRGATKRAFLKGLAALLPTVLTVFIIVKAYQFVSRTAGVWLTGVVSRIWTFVWGEGHAALRERAAPILGTILALIIVFLAALFVGLVLASFLGRKIWGAIERHLLNLPLIRLIYPPVKQITDFVFGEQQMSFKRVGLAEYPRKGVYSIGFVTGRGFKSLEERTGREMVTFFIPSSPTPFTGYSIQIPRDEIIELDLAVDEVIRYTVSGGVIVPAAQGGVGEAVSLPGGASGAGGDADTQE
jgi:uncharacterized membrane protein